MNDVRGRGSSVRGVRRRTNLALLVLLPLAALSGLVANSAGTRGPVHPSVVHGVIAVAMVMLAPWKSIIVRHGLKRRRNPWTSITLLVVVAATLVSGFAHTVGYSGGVGPLSLMQVHVGGGLLCLVLLAVHVSGRPARIRGTDADRRSFLRLGGLATLSTAAWIGVEGTLDLAGLPGGGRRFTGSHERGSFTPARMPVTSWFDDETQHMSGDEWHLRIDRRVLTLSDVLALPQDEFGAVLDCTSGWFSEQRWSGVRLDHLIGETARRSVTVRSATGYARRLPARDVTSLWLVTHAGGEPLSAGHGFPARLVAPGRRGFWWVKWVTDIETSDVPWWWQLPFPAT